MVYKQIGKVLSLTPVGLMIIAASQGMWTSLFCSWIINLFVDIVKNVSKPYMNQYWWLQRPRDAMNCSLLNMGGKISAKPGFPSGHTALTTYLAIRLMNHFDQILWLLTIPIVMVARVLCDCHTVVQVVAGLFVGLLAAYLFTFREFDLIAWVKQQNLQPTGIPIFSHRFVL